ncbi:hypothetical protein CNMCM6936_001714 [Aspergillus lentulus]|uniref:N-acetylglucosamine-induced protein 1 n=1 Tax=Aspergillus lentulus TaxID=293939 RepID=A0AAN6BU86_ASPLE|nr:hypothetical protein CNMCM6936_001714 [Aspergillus lentulus]KAF4172316.1 hypothetical protein CNMCM8060_001671 [Aspergillus lentulus]KAF4191843.1 hypothetical protein CNMCM8694_001284 [Aspergillus lentulus]KAF4209630.1 hypothetical protein CNMCM8927_006030 [Aspergillus lentulus]
MDTTSEPPAFNLTDTDREVLAMTDEQFVPHDWDNLKDIIVMGTTPHRVPLPLMHPLHFQYRINQHKREYLMMARLSPHTARNDLGALKRKPSDLFRYLSWSRDTKAQYGSITNFICKRRLGWHLPEPAGTSDSSGTAVADSEPVFPYNNPIPFADPSDYKILRNDWPYGLAPGIAHLCVWLRTPVPVQEHGGDLTHESRALIEEFVQRTFVDRLAREGYSNPEDRVLWFKNWTALQSVRSLEHIHVLVRDVPESILFEWTQEPPRDGVPN